jgi:adenylylsulfate kinase
MTGVVAWITGRPSSGKSTLGERLRGEIEARGRAACLLDGDAVRAALVPRPGYDPAARAAFYETLARLAALLAAQGLVVIVAATAHRRAFREAARALAPRFVEVFVDVSSATCAERDAKGLYAAAREGRAREVPGADLDFEPPDRADVVARGGLDDEALRAALGLLV